MGKGSGWPVAPAGPGTVEEVESGVSAAADPAAAASPKKKKKKGGIMGKVNEQLSLVT